MSNYTARSKTEAERLEDLLAIFEQHSGLTFTEGHEVTVGRWEMRAAYFRECQNEERAAHR